ncbi:MULTISPECIES: sigma-54-dependent Fis family transcriptional regulator [Sporosarcina]|uniref:sigma-54-dependent Fis family transcriptional regulator n=1 Tax=Sporosarcina TaxID=1569 RepID=UPI00058D0EFF|nr:MULTISPECIES: sigma-54-dependent Fis family transcriptional regulator [Sporosarcina]WJY27807.1 sigma-54-dependent Fis family transcriptional regulator [Sporosarcina sp. 0.2-SM1T-5]
MNSFDESLFPFYEFAVQNAGIGIHAVNSDGRTIIYNDKMKEIEGLELEDIRELSILELFKFRQQPSTLMEVLQNGKEQLNIKQTYWNRNETEITTINNTYPIVQDGRLIGAIELSHDVTALEKFVLQPLKKDRDPILLNHIVAESESMKRIIATAKKAVRARLPVLLIGEAGTGKDLVAQGIHHEVPDEDSSFYTLYCNRSDMQAIERLAGKLAEDAPFTLFCERIDFLSIKLQRKLLEILETSEAGSRQFIASIGEDPVELISSGVLLKELYYFFASFTIRFPPLRERTEDILPFVRRYLARRRESFGTVLEDITEDVQDLFLSYSWPGNMRELEVLLDEVASLASSETIISVDMLPLHFRNKSNALETGTALASPFQPAGGSDFLPLDKFLREAESYYIQRALAMHDGNITRTANALSMSRQNLQYRLRKNKNGGEA